MRIDLTSGGLQGPETSQTGRAGQAANQSSGAGGTSANPGAGTATGEDRVQFSSAQTRVAALTAQALGAPEVRQAKVDALGQAIGNGEYAVDAGKVADAMAAEYGAAALFR